MSEIKKTKRHSPSPHLQAKPDSSPTRDRVLEAAFSLTREGRFGFDTILLVELDGRSFRQVDLGTAIQRALDTATAKEAPKDHVENPGGPATAYVRFGEDGKIRFRSISTSNPKSLDNVPSYYALFQGTYDPGAARWTILLTLSPNLLKNKMLRSFKTGENMGPFGEQADDRLSPCKQFHQQQ